MRTKISIKGHSIHQMIIPLPIGFLIGSFLFDLAGYLLNRGDFWICGAYLSAIGVAAGLIAAIPGLIDLVYSVPPKSSGKKRGIKHALAMGTTVLLFAISFLLRDDIVSMPSIMNIILEFAGVLTIITGGWLGGTLVSRNFIGTEHRYADSGKWKEVSVSKANGQVEVGEINELKVDQMKLLHINGKRVVLGRTEEGYFAFDDHCPHRGGSLADGVLICSTVQCLWHGSQFNIKTGEVKSGPAEDKINTYTVTEIYGKLFVRF